MSARLSSALTDLATMSVAWIVVQLLLGLMPWRDAEARPGWAEIVVVGLVFGCIMALVDWFLWPRRQRRLQEDADANVNRPEGGSTGRL